MEKKYRDMCIVLIFSVCSVLVLSGLIITNYFMNGRLLTKAACTCTKCDVKDNGGNTDNIPVIDDKKTEDDSIWERNGFLCSIKTSDYCLMGDTNNKIELKVSDGFFISSIIINDKEYKLGLHEGFYKVIETEDNHIFCAYSYENTDHFILLDSSANVITDFKDYYEDSISNSVIYNDGMYEVHSFQKRIGYAIMGCDTYSDDEIFQIRKQYRYVENSGLELISKSDYTFKDIVEQEKELSGYGSCEEYLNR